MEEKNKKKNTENKKTGSDFWTVMLFSILLAAGFALIGFGVYLASVQNGQGYIVLAVGVLAVVVSASVYSILGNGSSGQTEILRSINDRLLMSEQAKRTVYRHKDREMLREAVIEDIRMGHYDAAMVLVDQMAKEFGFREEAEQFRDQITQARTRQQEEQVESAIVEIDAICANHEWDQALGMVERLKRVFPDHKKVVGLAERVNKTKEQHKRDLEKRFLGAAEVGDADRAMELLRELDTYLSADEAEPYRETARGVIGMKRENLGVRFKIAVHDKDWIDAVGVGETIIKDFPNSKMADEVREMLDLLRERAAGQRAAEQGRAVI